MAIFGRFFVNSVQFLGFLFDGEFCPYWHAGSGAFAAKNPPKAKNKPCPGSQQGFTGKSIGKMAHFW